MSWQADKAWSDRFIAEIKSILGECLIATGTMDEDRFENTDLITLRMPGSIRIACRVRKYAYLERYSNEFTLRCSRPSGATTEIDKILDGWGDYLFYGFADETETRLAAWLVGNLDVFRQWVTRYCRLFGDWPGELKTNLDGSSQFMTFRVEDIDPSFIVARQCVTLQTASA